MIYAPILIPTLNRIEHLKRCITALQNNPWAKYTLLIISVDYPPEEKYEGGYQKICSYLKEGIVGFGDVRIIYQKENLGWYDNYVFLKNYSADICDRFIYLEDDVEVSPNFIEYIDKGLELFEDNDDVVAICAAGFAGIEDKDNNVVLSQNFSAWGYGSWIRKDRELRQKINSQYVLNLVKNAKKILYLAYKNPGVLFSLQSLIFHKDLFSREYSDEVLVFDQTIKLYTMMEQKYVVGACAEKSRNLGYDGSGANCNAVIGVDKIEIDQRTYFDYHFTNPMIYRNYKPKYTIEVICRILICFIKLGVWRIGKGIIDGLNR